VSTWGRVWPPEMLTRQTSLVAPLPPQPHING
jgi:hypothetical protein